MAWWAVESSAVAGQSLDPCLSLVVLAGSVAAGKDLVRSYLAATHTASVTAQACVGTKGWNTV